MSKEDIVFVLNNGKPDGASFPFMFSSAALNLGVKVKIIVLGGAVEAFMKRNFERIVFSKAPEPVDLLPQLLEMDLEIMACKACIDALRVSSEELIDGIKIMGPVTFIEETTSANATISL
ncbi:MAG: DsrE family protein [Nitrososphaerota archaeon]|nr:DsrE family protein [Candidatus Nezhaarchaeota archaeon]MDW8049844.1 DsrE family protein [Nitrososphaerota archaeon]